MEHCIWWQVSSRCRTGTTHPQASPESQLQDFPLLSPLPHLNLLVGDNDVTCDKDFKHLFKRFRTLLLWMGGFHILNTTITPSILEWHLCEGGISFVSLWTLLNPSDKQDVPKALELLKHVSDLSLAPNDCNPTWIAQRCAIYLMGCICYFLVQSFTDVMLCLQQQLEYLSAASHLLLVLFWANPQRGEFIHANSIIHWHTGND